MAGEFAYDVAISLLAQDEPLGRRLAAAVRKHVADDKAFLYSRRQEQIATHGQLVELFTRVFRRDSRLAVVLYREGWGKTPYTRVEESALRDRLLKMGPKSILMVSLDGGYPDAWFPSSEFRASLGSGKDQFSVPQLAGIVAARLHELGGEQRQETAVERATRLQRETRTKEEREWQLQREGPERLETEAQALFARLRDQAEAVTQAGSDGMIYHTRHQACALNYRGRSLVAFWQRPHAMNSLQDAGLSLEVWAGTTELAYANSGEVRKLMTVRCEIALAEDGSWGWKPGQVRGAEQLPAFVTTDQLAEWAASELAEWGHRPTPAPRPGRRVIQPGVSWINDW